jgi:hypothetical protein
MSFMPDRSSHPLPPGRGRRRSGAAWLVFPALLLLAAVGAYLLWGILDDLAPAPLPAAAPASDSASLPPA